MNVAMFSDAFWPRVNGVTVSVDTFSRALCKAGHRVMVVCSEYPQGEAADQIAQAERAEQGAAPQLLRVPSYTVFFSHEDRYPKFHKWFWVEKEVSRFKPDVLHINTEFVIAEFGFHYGRKYKVPIVYTFHTMWEDYAANYFPHIPDFALRFAVRQYMKALIKKTDMVIAPTVQIQEWIKAYKVKKEIRLLPTGVDPALFSHTPEEADTFRKKIEEKEPRLKDKRILIFAGRIAKEKNISFILQLMPSLLSRHADLALLLVGNGPEMDEYREEARTLGIADKCVFSGYLPRNELSLCYAISEIFVFPSLTETQGLVTIEAMLSGIPVVAIGEMGTLQVMGGDNGGFMTGDDPDEFRGRVLQLLEDRALYEAKSAEAQRHAQKWTVESVAGNLVEIYREAAKLQ